MVVVILRDSESITSPLEWGSFDFVFVSLRVLDGGVAQGDEVSGHGHAGSFFGLVGGGNGYPPELSGGAIPVLFAFAGDRELFCPGFSPGLLEENEALCIWPP